MHTYISVCTCLCLYVFLFVCVCASFAIAKRILFNDMNTVGNGSFLMICLFAFIFCDYSLFVCCDFPFQLLRSYALFLVVYVFVMGFREQFKIIFRNVTTYLRTMTKFRFNHHFNHLY